MLFSRTCFAIATVLLIVGCSVEKSTDEKIEEWTKKKESESIFLHVNFYHLDEEHEETWETTKALAILRGVELKERSWGGITLNLFNVIDVIQGRTNPTEEMKNQDLKVLWKNMEDIRNDFGVLINSLGLEEAIKSKYLDFNVELVVDVRKDLMSRITVLEIDKSGVFKNTMFLLEADEDSIEAAKKKYTWHYSLGREQSDGTYLFTIIMTNSNEKIPLYVHNVTFKHKAYGELNYELLKKDYDFNPIRPSAIIRPSSRERLKFQVRNYFGKYGSLEVDNFQVDTGWYDDSHILSSE